MRHSVVDHLAEVVEALSLAHDVVKQGRGGGGVVLAYERHKDASCGISPAYHRR